ncbi:MAG TPA: hypothetical protein VL522_23385 [Bordetella sp.]|jgi:hypothetical protein|nr:hypothetical protein [Bordetella sp.]
MLQPNAPISVVLTAERWNSVLAILSEAPVPYRMTEPLIRDIHSQCMAADRDADMPDNVTPLHEAGC